MDTLYLVAVGGVSAVPGPDPAEHLAEVVLREGGDGVLAAVDADGGAPRDQEIKLHVGRRRLVKLQ